MIKKIFELMQESGVNYIEYHYMSYFIKSWRYNSQFCMILHECPDWEEVGDLSENLSYGYCFKSKFDDRINFLSKMSTKSIDLVTHKKLAAVVVGDDMLSKLLRGLWHKLIKMVCLFISESEEKIVKLEHMLVVDMEQESRRQLNFG